MDTSTTVSTAPVAVAAPAPERPKPPFRRLVVFVGANA